MIKSPTGTETVAVADIITLTDYYPFGMAMPGRTLSNSEHYRYGFNGMEKDDDWYGAGNEYTTEFRQLDVRTGRWMSMDPMMAVVPDRSPYEFVFNNPIALVDPDGLLPFGKGGGNKTTVKSKHGHANKGSGKSPKGSVGKKIADKEMKQTKTITNMTEKNRYFSSDRFKRTAEKKVSLTTGKLSQSINIVQTNLTRVYSGDHTNDGTGIDRKAPWTEALRTKGRVSDIILPYKDVNVEGIEMGLTIRIDYNTTDDLNERIPSSEVIVVLGYFPGQDPDNPIVNPEVLFVGDKPGGIGSFDHSQAGRGYKEYVIDGKNPYGTIRVELRRTLSVTGTISTGQLEVRAHGLSHQVNSIPVIY